MIIMMIMVNGDTGRDYKVEIALKDKKVNEAYKKKHFV